MNDDDDMMVDDSHFSLFISRTPASRPSTKPSAGQPVVLLVLFLVLSSHLLSSSVLPPTHVVGPPRVGGGPSCPQP